MLKNETAGQDRQCLPVDGLWINRDKRHVEKISDHPEEPVLVHLAGIEHLARPGATVEILGELHRFVPRGHAARKQKVDN